MRGVLRNGLPVQEPQQIAQAREADQAFIGQRRAEGLPCYENRGAQPGARRAPVLDDLWPIVLDALCNRAPGGTCSSASSCVCWALVSRLPSNRHRRASTRSRRRATKRSSTLTPGSSTFCARIQLVARSNKTLGRSVPVQHCAYSQRASAKPACRSLSVR